MSVEVKVSQNFKKEAKSFIKKFPSFLNDLLLLNNELMDNPLLGTSLGNNTYKIRLRIKSKGKGKSGGARIITFVEHEIIIEKSVENEHTTVNLLTIYDKSDRVSISDKEIDGLIKDL